MSMESNPTTTLLVLLGLLAIASAQSFSAFEINKVDKLVTLNGAYPTEVNKIEYHCLISSCGSKLHFILPAELEDNLVKISFGRDKTDIDAFPHSQKTYQHVGV